MELLLEPLSHAFMVKALMISALVGGVCGLLSCFMTLKGWALMGDAVSHAVLPGVVVAYALGLPFTLRCAELILSGMTSFISRQMKPSAMSCLAITRLVRTIRFSVACSFLMKMAFDADPLLC